IDSTKITFNTSPISGDSLMTVRMQVSLNETFATSVIDTMVHWKNIYKANASYDPIDLNAGIDLTKLSFPASRFSNGQLYYYRVKYRDHNVKWSNWSNATAFNFVTGVEEDVMPYVYNLEQNYPNPFNPSTQISFSIADAGQYSLKVFNILGQEIKTLVIRYLQPGNYNANFDAKGLSSGIYIYQLSGNNKVLTKKMMLIR
ncbi:MAG: T9SS type A sorting domain-containing protein, partial [Ignavibacteriaceae bacterium]|nr:T9SS type A sorting domain-containing protein [Ignavibacteriaceae bacterium]